MKGVFNEYTETIHRQEPGGVTVHTDCGAAFHADPDQLERMSVERAQQEFDATKCGRCFDEGRGY